MFTPKQLDEITFERATFGGYDVDAVDKVLEPLTQDYAVLYNENLMLKKKMRALIMKMKEQQPAAEDSGAQKALDNARRAAARIVLEAETKAAKILSDAQAQAEAETEAAATKAAPDQISAVQQRIHMCIQALDGLKEGETSAPLLIRKASIERPWMKFYPEDTTRMPAVPPLSLNRYLKIMCRDREEPVIHYYGTEIRWEQFAGMVDATARAMRAAGLGEGDQIPVLLEAVPEFLLVLLAAEKIGASVLCRGSAVAENAEIIRTTGARILFAHDYISQEAVSAYSDAGIERIILVNPWKLAQKEQLPQHIISSLKGRYAGPKVTDSCVCLWEDFLAASRIYIGKTDAQTDITRPLLRCDTTDSEGNVLQVVHSSQTILGVIHQIVCCSGAANARSGWLTAAVSPVTVEAVVTLLLAPICTGHLLILDPFADSADLDLELMRCKPAAWALGAAELEALVKSARIPADYDMGHLLSLTAGEALGNGLIGRVQQFLTDHNCEAAFTACYGKAEAGSAITLPAPGYEFGCGILGIPMPLNVVGIFRGTEECGYNRRGEICVTGPGIMLGYDSKEASAKALIRHEDGLLWFHTGDSGYMNEDGVIYAPSQIPTEQRNGENPLRRLEAELEARLNTAAIAGLVDYFFLVTPDRKKKDGMIPYLYAILEEGHTPDRIREEVRNALEGPEYAVEIVPLPESSFRLLRASRQNL